MECLVATVNLQTLNNGSKIRIGEDPKGIRENRKAGVRQSNNDLYTAHDIFIHWTKGTQSQHNCRIQQADTGRDKKNFHQAGLKEDEKTESKEVINQLRHSIKQ